MSTGEKKVRIGVIGASGYTGADLLRLLATHPRADVRLLTANAHAGKPLAAVYPHLGGLDLPTMIRVEDAEWADIEVAFCCLPHGTTQEIVAALPRHLKVVDLSADFRLRDPVVYAQWYGHEHRAPELQTQAVYGLTEHYREAIRGASLVACPGCYPTAALLLLRPLVAGKLIEAGWTWRRAGNAIHKSWDNTTLGQIALAGRQLKVNVNSAVRAVRAKALVERLLEGNASYRATKIASTEAMLADVRSRPEHKDDSEHERLMQMPEVRQQVAEMLMRHYTDWLDTKVPLLGERTPREAVRDRDGREAVAALIAQIERDGARQSPPLDPGIPAMLRRELGLG